MLGFALSCMRHQPSNTTASPVCSPPSLFTTSFEKAGFLTGARWTPAAVRAMDEMIEAHLVSLLEDANLTALHARRMMVKSRDIQLSRRLRGERA